MSNSEFLTYIHAIIDKGKFNATYKLALLMAISEICQNKVANANEAAFISYQELAEIFVKIYWNNTNFYPKNNGETIILRHGINVGNDNITEYLKEFKNTSQNNHWIMIDTKNKYYDELIEKTSKLIKDNPVNFLQNIHGSSKNVLFSKNPNKDGITLNAGIAYHFKNNPNIYNLARHKLIEVVMKNPKNNLTDENFTKIEKFLFGYS